MVLILSQAHMFYDTYICCLENNLFMIPLRGSKSWAMAIIWVLHLNFQDAFCFIKWFLKNISLFVWLHWVLVLAHRILSCGLWTPGCGMWDLVPRPGTEPGSPELGSPGKCFVFFFFFPISFHVLLPLLTYLGIIRLAHSNASPSRWDESFRNTSLKVLNITVAAIMSHHALFDCCTVTSHD